MNAIGINVSYYLFLKNFSEVRNVQFQCIFLGQRRLYKRKIQVIPMKFSRLIWATVAQNIFEIGFCQQDKGF